MTSPISASEVDRARISELKATIQDAEARIARIIGSYVHIKIAHAEVTRIAGAQAFTLRADGTNQLRIIYFGEDGSVGCYDDPPGVCGDC